jgi:hypothetical protein
MHAAQITALGYKLPDFIAVHWVSAQACASGASARMQAEQCA